MAQPDNLAIVKKILTESTDIVCNNLDPELLLRTMKTKGALTDNDVSYIRAKITSDDKAEEMLSILTKKPVTSYDIFMETLLEKGRKDLHEQIKNIELRHGYVSPNAGKDNKKPDKSDSGEDKKPDKSVSGLTPTDISAVIEELGIDELSNLYEKLGIPRREVEKAQKKADSNDPDEKAKSVFRKWQSNNGRKATKRAILDALEAARCISAMETLQAKWDLG